VLVLLVYPSLGTQAYPVSRVSLVCKALQVFLVEAQGCRESRASLVEAQDYKGLLGFKALQAFQEVVLASREQQG
jgi:hypothetical protein